MSSAGRSPDAGGGPQRYFCHQCNRTVTLPPSAAAELACPTCHGGFLEEFDLPNPNPNPRPIPLVSYQNSIEHDALFDPIPFASSSGNFHLRNPNDLTGLFGPDPSFFYRSPSPSHGPEPFNPLLFLQNYVQTRLSNRADIQVVFDGGVGGGDGTFSGANLGDYFVGPGLEQLIQQLALDDPNRHGPPPAASSAVKSLPDVKISGDLLASDEAQCAVCKDAFEIGATAKQMPCEHIYHKDCILPWLELHNSCPVCRYELPTDDPDYEQRRRGPANPNERAVTMEDGNSERERGGPANPNERTVTMGNGNSEREGGYRISLPWPFRGFGSQPEAATSSTEAGANNNASSRSSGGQEDRGSEPRQEDLD